MNDHDFENGTIVVQCLALVRLVQGSAKVPGHLDFEALNGRFSTFLIMILNLHVNTFILAYCEPKLTKNYNF